MSAALLTNVSPSLQRALADRRDELNRRFVRAQKRWPKLDGDRVLLELVEILPSVANVDDPSLADLIATAFDLIVLHSARDAFSTKPALRALLVAAFADPALRRVCLERPTQLLPALSNAIENLGEGGAAFVARLPSIAAVAPNAAALLSAGAVAAWSLGEPRLRDPALAAVTQLPPALWAAAYGDAACEPRVTATALTRESWIRPPATATAATSAPTWHVVARLGNFVGFGGAFDRPPLLVTTGTEDVSDRHHVHARCGDQIFSVTADAFGSRLRLAPSVINPPPALEPASRVNAQLLFQLTRRGVLTVGGESHRIDELDGATSYLGRDRLVFVTLAESHRIRVVALV